MGRCGADDFVRYLDFIVVVKFRIHEVSFSRNNVIDDCFGVISFESENDFDRIEVSFSPGL